MGIQRILLLAIFLVAGLLVSCQAGPAGQIALAAARASKIPRSIRASFRNPEIGVARGFGKRSDAVGGGYKESKFYTSHLVPRRRYVADERIRKGRSSGIRFKLTGGELRISRGFGKRSTGSSKATERTKSKIFQDLCTILFFFDSFLKNSYFCLVSKAPPTYLILFCL